MSHLGTYTHTSAWEHIHIQVIPAGTPVHKHSLTYTQAPDVNASVQPDGHGAIPLLDVWDAHFYNGHILLLTPLCVNQRKVMHLQETGGVAPNGEGDGRGELSSEETQLATTKRWIHLGEKLALICTSMFSVSSFWFTLIDKISIFSHFLLLIWGWCTGAAGWAR